MTQQEWDHGWKGEMPRPLPTPPTEGNLYETELKGQWQLEWLLPLLDFLCCCCFSSFSFFLPLSPRRLLSNGTISEAGSTARGHGGLGGRRRSNGAGPPCGWQMISSRRQSFYLFVSSQQTRRPEENDKCCVGRLAALHAATPLSFFLSFFVLVFAPEPNCAAALKGGQRPSFLQRLQLAANDGGAAERCR